MKNKKLWLVILVALVAIAPVLYFWYNSVSTTNQFANNLPEVRWNAGGPKLMNVGEEMKVGALQIVDGHIFYALLEDNQWHELRLTHATKNEAITFVIDFFKTAEQPTVILRRNLGDVWYVDFNVTSNGQKTTLLDWLAEKKLTL